MKRYKLAAASIFLLLMISGAAAQDFRSGGNIVVENETGPLTVAAGSVTVEGPVDGALTVYSGSATVTGPVEGDLKIYTGNAQIESRVDGDLTVAAGNFRMSDSAVVNGNADISSGEAFIAGRIDGNASVVTERLRISDSGLITGNLRHDTETFKNKGQVEGTVTEFQQRGNQFEFSGLNTFFTIAGFISKFVVGAILLILVPGYVNRVSKAVREETGITFLKGLVGLIAVPVLVVISAVTLIGIPLALLLASLYAITFWIATILGPYGVAEEIVGEGSKWISLLLGLVLYEALGFIPVIGWVAQAFIAVTGFGAVLMPGVQKVRERRSK